jgi:glycyl-tRNA synthetase beta chain
VNPTLLIEFGCEELPARALRAQVALLSEGLERKLREAGLLGADAGVRTFATPRRLAVQIDDVLPREPDRTLERKGPAEKAAFDSEGRPTRAAEGFARSVGLSVDRLERLENKQGRWLFARVEQPGQELGEILGEMLTATVREMAGARSMRWSDREERFLRPVRWLVALHGEQVVPLLLFGLNAGNATRGHRVHAPGEHRIASAADYESVLQSAFVLADFDRRRDRIATQVAKVAGQAALSVQTDEALLDEVSGLVEWPVAVIGSFDPAFLEVPAEALISSMREHQKSFPLFDGDGALASRFISVANIESADPALMVHGFERVIRPRLADARFFYDQDRQQPLADIAPRLDDMLFQEQLGSIGDKARRLERLASSIAPFFDADPSDCAHVASLCKCDLLSEMVGEFPELQGTMGRYYALADGEAPAVATAIESHYLPRHAADDLPGDPIGRALAVADRLDSLVGVFAAGKRPKGGKDPFALRRAALAVARILEQAGCRQPLRNLLDPAAEALRQQIDVEAGTLDEVERFILERLRAHLIERGIETNTLHAVTAVSAGSVADFVDRAKAVQAFADDPAVESLIAANKRAANLLERARTSELHDFQRTWLQIDAESALFDAIERVEGTLEELLEAKHYTDALQQLAALREPLDRFFDDVMVMVDDEALKNNRLALLRRLRGLFLQVADVARLGRA